jgi:hypothetical protein
MLPARLCQPAPPSARPTRCRPHLQGGGTRRDASWRAHYPSRWVPDFSSGGGGGGGRAGARQADVAYELIDYLRIPRQRPEALG